eukprot:198851_1
MSRRRSIEIAKTLISSCESVIQTDPGNRGITHLHIPGEMWRVFDFSEALPLHRASRVLINTGFAVCDFDPPTETDGPNGALAIARALVAQRFPPDLDSEFKADLNRHTRVTIMTDTPNMSVLKAVTEAACLGENVCVREFNERDVDSIVEEHDFLIAIERVSPAADGHVYSMSARCVDAQTARCHLLFERARELGVRTCGVGDGGNEVGMGKVSDEVKAHIPHGTRIAAATVTDHLITAGVSNWGGWALATGVFIARYAEALARTVDGGREWPWEEGVYEAGPWHNLMNSTIPSRSTEEKLLKAATSAGAHDGVTGSNGLSVDGIEWEEHMHVLGELRKIASRVFVSDDWGG